MLNRITFTGIDNHCKVKELITLQSEYPFVEYGVLVSINNTNKGIEKRYPNLVMLKGLKKENLNLSLHVCGKAAREIITKNNFDLFYKMIGNYLPMFQRIQFNIAGSKNCLPVTFNMQQQIIIQTASMDTNHLELLQSCNEKIVGFQDNSGGNGQVESLWMETEYFGYAGGLGPENVVSAVEEILEVRDKPFWIDMETHIRTNDKFDINKCRRVCELITEAKMII